MSEEKELANLLHKRRQGETKDRNQDLRLNGSTKRGESTSLLLAFHLDLPTVNRKEALLLHPYSDGPCLVRTKSTATKESAFSSVALAGKGQG